MRFISSTTGLFYNLRPLDAQGQVAGTKKAGTTLVPAAWFSPSAPSYSFWLRKSRYRSVNRAVSAAAM